MRRFHAAVTRFALAGLTAISLGTAMVVVGFVSSPGAPAFADTTPYELYCPGTPVGNIVLNDVVTDGTITPATPAEGQQFNLTNFQSTVTLPNAIASAAAALGNSAIVGTAAIKVDATGATPAAVAAPTIAINTPIPSPVPAAGLTLTLPATPGTVGPFTASGGAITLTVDPAVSLTVDVSGSNLNLTCTPYPNNSAPSGITTAAPTVPKASPVIASVTTGTTTSTSPTASTTSTTPLGTLTGAYELYCPGTPVGDIALNGVTTMAAISPSTVSSGTSFNVTNYQTSVNLPASLASAAAALSPTLTGSATAKVDVTGGTPASMATPTLNFTLTIPSPVPASGVTLQVPTPALASLGPFTATGSPVTVQNDSSTSLTLVISGAPLTLTCTAFPNNTIATEGILPTGTPAPTVPPLAPVIAVAASTSPTSTTTTSSSTTTSSTTTSSTTSTTTPLSSTTTSSSSTTSPPTSTSTTAAGGTTTTTKAAGTTTTAPPSSGTGGTSPPSTVATSSNKLAFTGPSTGLRVVGIAGMVLIVFGIALLALVDAPRRVLTRMVPALQAVTRYRPDVGGAARRGGAQMWRRAKDRAHWFLGR